jgi:predicted metallopeptidase
MWFETTTVLSYFEKNVKVVIYNILHQAFTTSSFLRLQKIGVAVAFLNTNNRHKPLLHSIQVSEAKVLIVGEGMLCNFFDIF